MPSAELMSQNCKQLTAYRWRGGVLHCLQNATKQFVSDAGSGNAQKEAPKISQKKVDVSASRRPVSTSDTIGDCTRQPFKSKALQSKLLSLHDLAARVGMCAVIAIEIGNIQGKKFE